MYNSNRYVNFKFFILYSGQFRDQKRLDLHEKSLDLSNYEIFPHKILKSRTFKKSSILSKIQRRGAQRSQMLPPLFLSPTIKSNVAIIIQHKSGRAANITNHTSMKQSKNLVPKFILTRQGISVQIGPYLSHKAV